MHGDSDSDEGPNDVFIQGKRSLRRSVAFRLAPFALLALILSGCASPAADADAEAPVPSAVAPSAEVPEPEPVPTTEAECLVGTWLLDNESFSVAMNAIEESVSDTLTGTVLLTVAPDSSTQTVYESWKHVIEVRGQSASVTIERNGIDHGKIVSLEADGTLSYQEVSNESVMVTSVGGMILPSAPVEGSKLAVGLFQCEADRLTINAEDTTTSMDRVS